MRARVRVRMSGLTRLLAAAAVVIAALLVATPALAAQYKIRLYAGNEGEVSCVNKEDWVTEDGKTRGDWTKDYVEITRDYDIEKGINLSDEFDVKVSDPTKYYFKGYRTSGKDNRDTGGLRDHIFVTQDMDFVVAYGSRGQMVKYTVRFVEQGTGKALTNDAGKTEETYEGKVGDKPVVAYSYVPGYRPLYNNITGTLKDGENVWNLPYVALETATTTTNEGTTTTTTSGGGTTVTTVSGGGTTTTTTTSGGGSSSSTSESGDEGEDENASTDNATTGDDANNTESTDATETTTPATPPATEEILDVDNPLASPDEGTDEGTTGSDDGTDAEKPNHGNTTTGSTDSSETEGSGESGPSFAVAIGAIIGALLLGLLGFLWYRTKHETDDGFDIDLGDDED